MEYNLFLITSPLQLINAIEAKAHFNLTLNILVVIFTEHESKNKNQISRLINEDEWDKVIRFDQRLKNSKTTFLRQIKLVRLLQKESYNMLFCGDFSSINKMIIANVQKEKVYLMDDGAVTINRYLNELGVKYSDQKIPLKKKVRQWRFNLFGLKTIPTDTINMFTSYELTPHGNEEIVRNELKYFKETFLAQAMIDNTVYFLGQPLSEIHVIKRETYLEYIQSIKNYYDTKIVYIPHRAEHVIDDIMAMEDERFKVVYTDLPIELEFITTNRYPMQIGSFFSSALFTLNIIYPEATIIAFEIEHEKMITPRPAIDNVYNYMAKSTSIKKVPLGSL